MTISIDTLCSRLREIPDSFRVHPKSTNAPDLAAVVADTLLHLSNRLPANKRVRIYNWSNISKTKRD